MATVEVLSSRDLRNHAGRLFRDAAEGRVALLTKHGRPEIVAIPFDSILLELGVHKTLTIRLFA